MNKISVAVVDDNEKIVETICNELERDEEINIVGKAKNGEEAFDIIKKTNPDVVVLDLIMPKMDGLSLMNKRVKEPKWRGFRYKFRCKLMHQNSLTPRINITHYIPVH